jgi:hypothetical protein
MTRRKFGFFRTGQVVAVAQSYAELLQHKDELTPEALKLIEEHVRQKSMGTNNKMFVLGELMPCKIKMTCLGCEHLQDISEEDCLKEGIIRISDNAYTFKGGMVFETAREAFASLIDKVEGRGTWAKNGEVKVYEFELVKEE